MGFSLYQKHPMLGHFFCSHAADSKTEEKMLDCGDTVWGMAFGPCVSNRAKSVKGQELLLATGLTNGMIKVWVVSTGKSFCSSV